MYNNLKYILILIILTCIAIPKEYGTIRGKIELVRVYDGDTFIINIVNYPKIIGQNIRIRIYGINTPEIRGTDIRTKLLAKEARDYLKEILVGKKIVLKNVRRGKYFRIVANVYADKINVGELMLEKGYAVEYYGGKK